MPSLYPTPERRPSRPSSSPPTCSSPRVTTAVAGRRRAGHSSPPQREQVAEDKGEPRATPPGPPHSLSPSPSPLLVIPPSRLSAAVAHVRRARGHRRSRGRWPCPRASPRWATPTGGSGRSRGALLLADRRRRQHLVAGVIRRLRLPPVFPEQALNGHTPL